MADRGHELTDEILNNLETRIADEYAVATNDMKRKFREYMEKFKAEDEKQKALLDAGKITQKEYSDWRYRHMMVGKRWEAMKDVLAQDLEHASDIALKISGEKMADVYALNANFATYQIEHDAKIDTGFTLYNHDTAEYLLSDERQLMPGPSTRKAKEIAANKAMQWNKQKIQSAVLQGVLQGEGPHKVAERLRQVGQMDYNASVRYARTMTTSAQNAGRYNSFRRARDLGVDLTIEWMATLDSRTRHEHRMMHGQRTTVDEPFHTPDGYTIYYPADCTGTSNAPQKDIWNCRCTLRAMVKGYERETIRSSPKMGDMTFEEWQQEKAPKPSPANKEPKFQSRFKPAENTKEAESFIRQIVDDKVFGAVGVSYDGVDVAVANIVNKTLIDLYDEFDIKKFGGIIAPAGNTKLGKMISNATAAYSPIQRSFLLNRKSLKNVKTAEKAIANEKAVVTDVLLHPEKYDLSRMSSRARKVIEAAKTSGRGTVPDTIQDVLHHEFGHSLEKQLRGMDSYKGILDNMPKYAPKISGYATESASEYIAESFASWRKGEGLIDPVLEKAFKNIRRK